MKFAYLVLLLVLVSCGETIQQVPSVTPTQAPAVERPVQAPEPRTVEVAINRYQFIPSTVRINAGDRIVWDNDDGTSHSIKLLGAPTGAVLSPGEQHDLIIDDPGTYRYSCGIHAKMQGTIVVE